MPSILGLFSINFITYPKKKKLDTQELPFEQELIGRKIDQPHVQEYKEIQVYNKKIMHKEKIKKHTM